MPQVLTHHPSTPCAAVRALSAEIARLPDGALLLGFALAGNIAQLRIPQRRSGARADELWRHTCFEAFIALGNQAGYFELNLSPSGDWAVYRFTGYRAGMVPSDAFGAPQISVRTENDRLQLEARFAGGTLAPRNEARVALTAVIEAEDGRLSYWALRHPPGKPDFHHPDGFVLGIHA